MAQEVFRDGRRATAVEPRCARCGAPFHCGMNDLQGCWCAKLPALPREAFDNAAGCLCETCLRRALRDAGMTVADVSR